MGASFTTSTRRHAWVNSLMVGVVGASAFLASCSLPGHSSAPSTVGASVATQPQDTPAEPTATPSALPSVSRSDLKTLPVPSLCGHPAGQLQNYRLPGLGSNEGYVEVEGIARDSYPGPKPVFTDLTGDGVGDASVVLACSQGGVSWPQIVAFYAPGPAVLGWVDLGRDVPGAAQQERADVTRMRRAGRDIRLSFDSYDGAGSNVSSWTTTLSYDGHGVVAQHAKHTAPSDGAPLPAVSATRSSGARVAEFLRNRFDLPQLEHPELRPSGACLLVQVHGADFDNGAIDLDVLIPGGDCGGDIAATEYRIRNDKVVRTADYCECLPTEPAYSNIIAPYDGLESATFDVVPDGNGWTLVPHPPPSAHTSDGDALSAVRGMPRPAGAGWN